MKKVLEILKDNSNINNIGLVNYAKTVTEIHEHYMKFVEWKNKNTRISNHEEGLVYIINPPEYIKDHNWLSSSELYEYWLNLPENKKGE